MPIGIGAGAAGATGDAAIVMVRVNGKEMMVDLVADPGTVYPVVSDSIPQSNPPLMVGAGASSSPHTGSSSGTPAAPGLDGFDGDMEGPDLIPIQEEEPGSKVASAGLPCWACCQSVCREWSFRWP